MTLEAQGVGNKKHQAEAHQKLVEKLLQRPARLWDGQ
jgi:hypothetical protein